MPTTKNLVFISLVLFTIAFTFFAFDGYYFYDDYSYAYYAFQLQNKTYQITTPDIFAHRWGLLVPLAIFYKVFGISDFTNVILPLLASLCSLWLLFCIAQSFLEDNAVILVIIFGGLDFYTLFFAGKIYPDVLLTTLALASIYVFLKRKNSFSQAFLFVFFSFWAFLCKELIVYFLPFYLIVLYRDIRHQQHLLFWLYSALLSFLFLIIYLGLYKYYTGSWFYRFDLIQNQHYTVSFSYFDKPLIHTLKRISYEPFLMFVETSLWVTMAGGFALYFFYRKNFPPYIREVMLLFALAVLSFWFLSTSVRYYNPIGLFPRHILFLLPLAALLSGYALALQNKKVYLCISFFWILGAFWAFKSVGLKYSLLYGLLSFSLVITLFVLKLFKHYSIFLSLILLLHPLYTMLKPSETGYQDEKKIFEKHLQNFSQPSIIFTDDKLASGYLWYFRFQKPKNIIIKEFSEYEKYATDHHSQDTYVLLNEHSIEYFKLIGYPPAKYVERAKKEWNKVAVSGKVCLYKKP
jgi:hypothetical protein